MLRKRPFFSSFRSRTIGVYSVLITGNIAVWMLAFLAFHDSAVLIGTAFLAFTLGLRHGVDADHIAAIDNVTRRLMQEGKRPVGVGLFFALGHSTIVIIASFAIFLTASTLRGKLTGLQAVGELIGSSISISFLLAIGLMNLFIFRNVYRTFRRVKEGENCSELSLEHLATHGGLLARLFKPCFRLMSHSWNMFPLGFLFGLGFETATELSLFGISATAAGRGLPLSSIMLFPLLFAAGMVLVDTTDGILMVGAYGWAFVKPIRKLYYNLTITFASIMVAFFVGGIEAAGLLKDQLSLTGGVWDLVGNLNDNFGSLGFSIIGVFVACWAGSILVYRVRGFHRVE